MKVRDLLLQIQSEILAIPSIGYTENPDGTILEPLIARSKAADVVGQYISKVGNTEVKLSEHHG